ncbi:MAG TPA: AAA family ATPase [Halobacteriales archaeon]|jgi:cell division control protein 6|nr:AAA family ATPase [Halobacteriales archaeon]
MDDIPKNNTQYISNPNSNPSITSGLFENLLSVEPIFNNKELLRHSFTPDTLPHRDSQIQTLASILVAALRGDTPSNILIYGKTGTGKTASVNFVTRELEQTSTHYDIPCDVKFINCEVVDTKYRILAELANTFIEKNTEYILKQISKLEESLTNSPSTFPTNDQHLQLEEISKLKGDLNSFTKVPMTGWPTDTVYSTLVKAVDYRERVVVIILDEIDKLVEKSGDDILYNLSRMNSDLDRSRVSIKGISNDLTFTDHLDPRVKSSLGEEEIIFPPYDAHQLNDILQNRATIAFKEGVLGPGVIRMCSGFAAREHGDARRALDLLRTAGELAERSGDSEVTTDYVEAAQEKIELDRVIEVIRTLPDQSKFVLFTILVLTTKDVSHITTGEVYNLYRQLCKNQELDVLTHRRVTDLISELDMLGIVNAIVVSKGRYGRTKQITLSVPQAHVEKELLSNQRNQRLFTGLEDISIIFQSQF